MTAHIPYPGQYPPGQPPWDYDPDPIAHTDFEPIWDFDPDLDTYVPHLRHCRACRHTYDTGFDLPPEAHAYCPTNPVRQHRGH